MKYNKLVRDKIPEIIKKDNQRPKIHIASEKEYWDKLKKKLIEEADEFFETPDEGEFVDVLEVIHAISDFKGFDRNEVNKMRLEKAMKKGRFRERIILEEVKD